MKWSFQLARIAGIDVRIHATFFLLLAWFGVVYFLEGGYGAMVIGLSFIILLFACVVLHEFGHALAARAYGINTPDITLLPIGGIARLERMPEKPWQELVVALAGPAVNVVIAFGLYIVIGRFFGLGDLEELAEGRGNLLTQLLAINVILVVFNLLPAFPMDGGRVLRALLATRLSHARATRIAATIGQIVAVLFGLLGLFGGNPFLLFIAVFVFFGARAEANFATFKETAEGTHVAAVMHPTGPVLMSGMTVSDAVQAAMQGHEGVLPVADASLHLVGMIPADTLARALRWDPTAKIDQMVRHDFAAIISDASLSQAVAVMRESAQSVFPVVNAGGQLVGMLKREDVERAFAQAS
ncbi:MAG: site-2 protease family protein [Chthoniobacterales bacterium]